MQHCKSQHRILTLEEEEKNLESVLTNGQMMRKIQASTFYTKCLCQVKEEKAEMRTDENEATKLDPGNFKNDLFFSGEETLLSFLVGIKPVTFRSLVCCFAN